LFEIIKIKMGCHVSVGEDITNPSSNMFELKNSSKWPESIAGHWDWKEDGQISHVILKPGGHVTYENDWVDGTWQVLPNGLVEVNQFGETLKFTVNEKVKAMVLVDPIRNPPIVAT